MGGGQDKLTLDLYHALAKHFTKEGQVAENFTNTWSWALICRAMNVAQITTIALSWCHDNIGVQYGKTKTDQFGRKTCLIKHVFCNPFQPWVNNFNFPPHFCSRDFLTQFPPHLP